MNRFGTVRDLIFAMLSVGAIATAASAQLPDRRGENPLNEAVARQKIADQKAEKEVQAAIADAERLLKTNPPKAVQALRTAQVLADSPSLSTETRKRLVESLERKIAAIQGRPLPEAGVKPGSGEKPDPIGVSVKRDRQAAFRNYVAEIKAVRDGVTRYARLQQAGMKHDAELELARLAKEFPNNDAVINLLQRDPLESRVKDALARTDLAKRRIDALNSSDGAQAPIGGNGDIEFPQDWKEKTARRLQTIKLTAEEKKIVEALNKPVTVNWNGKPLDEALQELSNILDQKLFIDEKAVNDLGIDLRKPFTLQANRVSAKTVLRQVLASQGLTFVLKDQVIQVMDTERAKNMLVTRVYYLGDVVNGVGPFGNIAWGPFLNFEQTIANVDTIMKAITSSIEPLAWKEKGGPASITFHYPSMSIIVRASAEVHASLGATLSGGR